MVHLWRPSGFRAVASDIEIYQKRDVVGHVAPWSSRVPERLARVADHPLVGEAKASA